MNINESRFYLPINDIIKLSTITKERGVFMITEGFEHWMQLNKNLFKPFSEWNKFSTELCYKTMQDQLEFLNDRLSHLSDHCKQLMHVKKPEEFFNLQKDCMQEELKASMHHIEKTIKHLVEELQTFSNLCATTVEKTANTKPNKN